VTIELPPQAGLAAYDTMSYTMFVTNDYSTSYDNGPGAATEVPAPILMNISTRKRLLRVNGVFWEESAPGLIS
jgi:hypothetical protein